MREVVFEPAANAKLAEDECHPGDSSFGPRPPASREQ
jgi:hypothetical protein